MATEEVDPATAVEWRAWLDANGRSAGEVWFVVHHKAAAGAHLPLAEAVEHALCYGWIDGQARKRDDLSFSVRFTPRNPKSTWSKINRERVERLVDRGLIAPPGQAMIDLAKQTGTWDLLADAQDGIVPADLQALFDADPVAGAHFHAFPPSTREAILAWIVLAKRPETRRRRLLKTVELARQNVRAR